MGGVEESKWGIHGDGRRLDFGAEHTIPYTDDMLYNCTPETHVILFTNVTPINLILKKDTVLLKSGIFMIFLNFIFPILTSILVLLIFKF